MAKIAFTAKDGTRYSFANSQQFLDLVTAEIAAWTWLSNYNGHREASPYTQNVVVPLAATQTSLTQSPADVESAKTTFQQYLNFVPQVHAKTALRAWIYPLAMANHKQALYSLAYLAQEAGVITAFPDTFSGGSDWIIGISRAMAFQGSWKPGERAAFDEAQAGLSAGEAATALAQTRELQSSVEELERKAHESDAVRTANNAAADAEMVEAAANLIAQMEAKFKEKSDALDSEWTRFTLEFNSQLALKAPAGYWKSKHKSHTTWVARLAIALIIGASIGAYVLHELAWQIFGPLRFNQIPSWFQVITFSLAALVYVLLLRSTLRLLMSHVHLSLDSAERQTMIVSYLALVRRGGIKEESLDKILSSIFRPTGDGIVKDEGIPLSALSELFKR